MEWNGSTYRMWEENNLGQVGWWFKVYTADSRYDEKFPVGKMFGPFGSEQGCSNGLAALLDKHKIKA